MPASTFTSTLTSADWLVLAGYLALLVITGWLFSRKEQKTTSDYFLAGRRMPMWAVAVSIIATSLSAATFVGAPEQSYKGDLTYLSTNIGGLIAVFVVAWFFIPAFYRNNCTTVYELLERRFGTSSKHATSAAFMLGRLFASGARIYIGAIPLCMILFGAGAADSPNYLWMMVASIAALTLVGTVYALVGGIAGVIWTDVIQTIVLVVAVIAAIVVLWMKMRYMPVDDLVSNLRTSVPMGQEAAGSWGKLTVIRSGVATTSSGTHIDWSQNFTLLTAVLGFSLLNIAAYGTDHDMVQRMLTCKNAIQGGRSVFLSLAIGVPLVLAFLVVGLLLYHYYNAGFYWGWMPREFPAYVPNGPRDSKHVFVNFILTDMPPGLRALMLAGLFAAGVGSLTSAINAMAATTISDFYKRALPNKGERHYLFASRIAVLGWGLALAAFAVLCFFWQKSSPQTTLIGLALGVMTFAYAGLLAVFLTALFTKRGNTRSVIAALITGFVVIALLQDWAWPRWTPHIPLVGPRLSTLTLAFPWHMTIGTTLAFLVCIAGRPRTVATNAESPTANCEMCGYPLGSPAITKCPECGHAALGGTGVPPV